MRKTLLMIVPLLVGVLLFSTCEQPTEPDEEQEEEVTTPTPVVLNEIEYQDTLMVFKWSVCMDEDFFKYSLFSSDDESMENRETLFETSNRVDTTFSQTIISDARFYQVQVMNLDEEKSLSNVVNKSLMFSKVLDGSESDIGHSVQQTEDGGYIIIGRTRSFGNDDDDVWLIKTDSNGDEEWDKTFGGSEHSRGSDGKITNDGGYIITGTVSDSIGNDVMLIKTDSQGNEEWNQTFGGSESDYGHSVQQTTDGGYIITGQTNSFGNGSTDVWLIKTDSEGNEEWNQTFGGSSADWGLSVQQTTDGGYIITGNTESFGNGDRDVWLIKTNSQGDEEWNQTFGGSSPDYGYSVIQTDDGGYIITGNTESFGNGGSDVWLIKTDSNGNEEWNQTFGGSSYDEGDFVIQTTDGGYCIVGGISDVSNSYDVWLIKTDANGVNVWDRTYGGSDLEIALCVQQTTDDGYIIVVAKLEAGNFHIWLIKTNSEGITVP